MIDDNTPPPPKKNKFDSCDTDSTEKQPLFRFSHLNNIFNLFFLGFQPQLLS